VEHLPILSRVIVLSRPFFATRSGSGGMASKKKPG
jgi:hypothetical protein